MQLHPRIVPQAKGQTRLSRLLYRTCNASILRESSSQQHQHQQMMFISGAPAAPSDEAHARGCTWYGECSQQRRILVEQVNPIAKCHTTRAANNGSGGDSTDNESQTIDVLNPTIGCFARNKKATIATSIIQAFIHLYIDDSNTSPTESIACQIL